MGKLETPAESMRGGMNLVREALDMREKTEFSGIESGDYVKLDLAGTAGDVDGSEYDGVLGKVKGSSFDERGLDVLQIMTPDADIGKYLPDYAKGSWKNEGEDGYFFEIRPHHLTKVEGEVREVAEGDPVGVSLALRDEQENGGAIIRKYDVRDETAGEDMPWMEAVFTVEKDMLNPDAPVRKRWSIMYADKPEGEKDRQINMGGASEGEVKDEIRKLIDHGRVVYARTHFAKAE